MVSFKEQLTILLWKNWAHRKRMKIRLLIEILWPLILFLILWWVRTRGLKYREPNCHVIEKALPSVGGFEFVQNFICTMNNTCYDDYVENTNSRRWDDAVIVKLMKDTTPLLKDILGSTSSRSTLVLLWKDVMSYMKVLSKLQEVDSFKRLGTVRLRELMNRDGYLRFKATIGIYTGFDKSFIEDFLNIAINLEKLNEENIDEVLNDVRNGNCSSNKTYALLSFPSGKSFEEFCELDRDEASMLLFIFGNYVDREGLLNKLNDVVEVDDAEQQVKSSLPGKIFLYDFETLGKLAQLGRKFMEAGSFLRGFANFTGAKMASVLVYKGLCGDKMTSARGLFEIDPGKPNRYYDTLRDQLTDWNPDHKYENDPDISTACNAVFQRLESMPISSFMWRQIKPIIRGFIFYAPDTEVTRLLMERVESKFLQLQNIELTINTVIQFLHRIRLWIHTNVDDLNSVKKFVSSQRNVDTIINLLGITVSRSDRNQIYSIINYLESSSIEATLERLDFMSELLSEIVGCVRYNKTRGFPTEWEAVNEGHKLLQSEKLWAVVVFSNVDGDSVENTTLPAHLIYKIRMDSDKVDGTRAVRDRLTSKGPRRRPLFDMKYMTYGFIFLQEMIERSVIELITGEEMSEEQVYLQQYPYPCYIVDQFIRAISRTFPMFMVLSWVYASAMIIKSVVLEKERRLREVMKIMGVSNAAIWLSWFIESFIIMFTSSSALTLLLKYGKVIEFSDPLLIWIFLISYTVATICFSFLVSTFFSKANSAAAAGGVIFFISYLPYNMMLIWEEKLEWFETLAGCLISNVAFGFGCTYLARYELDGSGAQWTNLSWKSLPDDDFNLVYCILMLWVDSLIYMFLTWYIESVFPGEYGVPRPWNFFLKRTYWGKPKPIQLSSDADMHGESSLFRSVYSPGHPSENLEPDPAGLTCGVMVTNLSKTYSNGKKALNNLSINFYENQITSFLGHNGAGKTTTISILSGLYPPTSGTALVNGLDIRNDMQEIRKNFGFCPQFDVLFDKLTVIEHLEFYARLKGKKSKDKEVMKEFEDMLNEMGIYHKRNSYPSDLSGGMKRKLSVAIAFVGGSKTIFLDEPTSGVDPFSRRSIWELLLKYKHGRTVILTTHFMDEADILGDRIAIISQGKLKALGSSLFLKSHFGQGYTLHLVKSEKFILKEAVNDLNIPTSLNPALMGHDTIIEKFVQQVVPNAFITENVGTEIAFLLPYLEVESFSLLFEKLKEGLESIGIVSYGISDTSLEDVFLKITVDDLAVTAESFSAMSSSCKRRFIRLLNSCRERAGGSEVNAVTAFPPREPSDLTNSTGIGLCAYPMCNANGDFFKKPDNVDAEETTTYSGSTTITFSTDRRPNAEAISSIPEAEAVTTSLLEEPITIDICTPPAPGWAKLKSHLSCCYCLCAIQMYMIIKKRLWNSKRNLKAIFFEIILPALFIATTLAFTLILPPVMNEAPREITPWTYKPPNHIFFSEPNITRRRGVPSSFRAALNELMGPIGMGTACLEDQQSRICDSSKWKNVSVQQFNNSRMEFYGAKFPACDCDIGTLRCEKNPDVKFPRLKTPTNDYILDVSNTNIPEWILKTYNKYLDSRYGGFELQLRQPAVSMTSYLNLWTNLTTLLPLPTLEMTDDHFHEKPTIDTFLNPEFSPSAAVVYKVWYEHRGWVSSIAYLNALHNLWLRAKLPEEYKNHKSNFGITLIQHPMNFTSSQSNKESFKITGLGIIHAICIIFALSFIPASFTVYLIEERKCGGKHLHLVSGVRPITYWIANFMFDMGKYVVPTALCLLLFYLFDAKAYIGKESFWAFLCMLLLYGWASVPAMYPFSFLFGVPSTAFVVLACCNLFIGVVTTVSTFVLESFPDEKLEAVGEVLKKVFLVFPHFCLGRGCIELVKLHALEHTSLNGFSVTGDRVADRFAWNHLGDKLFYLGLHGIVYFASNLIFEYAPRLSYKMFSSKEQIRCEEDIDVRKERERVEQSTTSSMTLTATNLTKYYRGKRHPAVNGITFGIGKGECFGLLGVNGAGKSSTFKMLASSMSPSSGHATICGEDSSSDAARKHFGYCPQEDSIDPLLTGYELLTLYGRLRGLNATDTKNAAERLIKMLGLTRYANRNCGTYSGGNKRKLSAGIALIGDPEVIFLDEPTSGMDPGARRDLWKVILDMLHVGKTVVLTSHSMEECEILCTKIAIMVNGQFMCLGSLQHLKNRFGKGYTLTIRCIESLQDSLLKRMENDLPAATMEDQHCLQLKFNIPQEAAHLGEIFSKLSSYKKEALIEDYSVSQTTLDDIFVKFASQQMDSLDR